MPKFVENKFWNWVITGVLILSVSALIGAGKYGTDIYYKVQNNTEKIGTKAEQTDVDINTENIKDSRKVQNSISNKLQSLEINMATKENIKRIEDILIWQHIESKKLINEN